MNIIIITITNTNNNIETIKRDISFIKNIFNSPVIGTSFLKRLLI